MKRAKLRKRQLKRVTVLNWEVKVKDGRTVKEVKIDAGSKKVLAVENDH